MPEEKRKRLVLIDGHANVFRAYHGVKTPLTTTKGEPTHAILGFFNTFARLRKMVDCTHVAVVFDPAGPTFRHDALETYKATRKETPPDLITQLARIRQIIAAMKLPALEAPGYEADDLLATLACRAVDAGGEALICSVDKDILQMVRPGIGVLREHLGKIEEVTEAGVREKLGVAPSQVADYLAMVGDSSDNVPGIPGVGPKTAAELLNQYGSLEAIVAATPELTEKKKIRERFAEFGARAVETLKLTRLVTDIPVDFSWERFRWQFEPTEELGALLRELEFGRMLADFGLAAAPAPKAPATPAPVAASPTGEALSLFDAPASAPEPPLRAAGPRTARATNYRAVVTKEDLAKTIAAIRAAGIAAIDTETESLDPSAGDIVGLSLAWEPDAGVYIPLRHHDSSPQLPLDFVRTQLDALFSEPGIRWFAHHWHFDLKVLLANGFNPPSAVAGDSMLAAFLVTPDRGTDSSGRGLKALALDRLGIAMTPISELIGDGSGLLTMASVAVVDATPYAAADADVTLQLNRYFDPLLDERELRRIYEEIELPLTPVLAAMETEGIRIDVPYFRDLAVEESKRLAAIAEDIFATIGKSINLNSTQQLAALLFDELGLPPGKKTKSGYSTDVEVLEDLRDKHPLPAKLLDYRQHQKLLSTYIEALPRAVSPRTGRVHTSYSQIDAATGRLASSSPNLQNIPVRTEDGRRIRRGFVARADGWTLLAADYSQIELRILAHISGDAALTEAFRTGGDIHTLTASNVFGVPKEEVTSELRGRAKAVNFGIVYGMSAFRLARDLGISQGEAQRFIADYFNVYRGVREYIEGTKQFARDHGFVRTLLGRRRPMADIRSSNPNVRAFAERVAINTPIQGTSADMIKLAMIRVHRRLQAEGYRAKLILQVHDELIFDSPQDETDRLASMVREEMVAALPLDVPIKVDVEVGPTWADV